MINKKFTSLEQLNRLTDSLVDDIIASSDEEIWDEAKAQFDNPTEEVERLQNIINKALFNTGEFK
jgi:hypothetical protein